MLSTTKILNDHHKKNRKIAKKKTTILTLVLSIALTSNNNVSAQQLDFSRHGCYFDKGLCNNNEFCYDDSLLGQCLPNDNPQQYLREIPPLTETDKEILSLELEKLTDGGFAWTDVFTQCILQNLLDSFKLGTTLDEESCALFLNDNPDENDDDSDEQDQLRADEEQQEQDKEDQEVTSKELVPQDALLFEDDNGITNVVPKKMILQDDSSEADSDTKYLEADPDSDEDDLLIEPNGEELMAAYLENARIQEEAEEQEQNQFIDPAQFQDMRLPEVEVDEYDEDPAMLEEKVIWPEEVVNASPYMEDYDYDNQDTITNDVRKIKKRGGQQPPEYFEYSSKELPPYFYPLEQEEDQYDYPLEEDGDQEYADQILVDPSSNVISRLGLNAGLGSRIFNRNERLDVKKPGPFYQNSANNFYFDKPSGEASLENQKENDTKNVGQAEYEMPLLAPVKDKRELILEQNGMPEKQAIKNYVHIALKNRFNTYKQGEAFIKFLATEFNIPPEALREKLIENQHVQFRVDANPQDIDAIQMAKRIDQDSSLHSKIGDQIGVEIDRAAPGQKDSIKSSLFSTGITNFNLLLLLVVAASTLAAVIVALAVIMLIKRRKRILRKQGLLLNGQEEENGAQDEYKQLCRDWSRSSKNVDSSKSIHKKVQNQESKESQRSSTSSWPEEPTTTNMDISTGHMVLAYMEDHLKNKQRLEQEWVSLCGYEAEPCATTVAFKAENKNKNRYPDKLPYDHNRVILNAMVNASSSDYINASTITDHDPRNPSYIVTQAPLSSTVADFWQMIWEQGCVVIVMLTRLQDNGHQLCHRYWPEEGSEQYHIFEVHLVSEHIWCDDYLVRSVYLKNTRTGETRTVTQFHFRSWPAHGVPMSTKALLEFRRKVNKSYRGRSCPICIHCSDGVGRSGTYTLIDMVLNRMSKGCKEIDIAAALEHIRDQRGGMVQSRQQFEFCLMAVAEEVHAILKALPQ